LWKTTVLLTIKQKSGKWKAVRHLPNSLGKARRENKPGAKWMVINKETKNKPFVLPVEV